MPIAFDEEIIYRLMLAKLKPKCSCTPDGIPPIFFKSLALFLCEPLKLIFERSYLDSRVPNVFREAIVTAVLKKGDKSSVSNYRPVSQGSVSCNIRLIGLKLRGFKRL